MAQRQETDTPERRIKMSQEGKAIIPKEGPSLKKDSNPLSSPRHAPLHHKSFPAIQREGTKHMPSSLFFLKLMQAALITMSTISSAPICLMSKTKGGRSSSTPFNESVLPPDGDDKSCTPPTWQQAAKLHFHFC